MLRPLLLLLLLALVARAVWRLLDGVVQGALGPQGPVRAGQRPTGPRGVRMVQDPVCGTYVVPEKAVTLTSGGQQLYFCSDACRSKYKQTA